MTRIIAGLARSIALEVPESGTRPTGDRVRESLFAALESADAIRGARVLDLYAGSGALALESISRGAAAADLVEKSARAAAIAQRNADRVVRSAGSDAQVRVHRESVNAFLRLRGASALFDLVFLDPPYDLDEGALSTALAGVAALLSPDALVVIERASRSPEPGLPDALTMVRSKRYGDTTVWWAELATTE